LGGASEAGGLSCREIADVEREPHVRLDYENVGYPSVTGFVRLHRQTLWLMATQLLWGGLVSGTFINALVFAQREQEDPYGRASSMVIMVILSLVSGFFSYRVSLRINRGPRRPVTKPYLRYFGSTVLAMWLSWWVFIFGGVCFLYGTPLWLVLLAFFVPAWLLFATNIPTRAKIARWANAEDRTGAPDRR
jgi:hypothetical protein